MEERSLSEEMGLSVLELCYGNEESLAATNPNHKAAIIFLPPEKGCYESLPVILTNL